MDARVGDHARILSNKLFRAILNNNLNQVRICIRQGVDLKLENVFHSVNNDDYRVCPLAKACCLGHEKIMKELLKAGADPNQISGSYYPRTVLQMAADKGGITFSMIQTLISYGIDLNLRAEDFGDDTPLLALCDCLASQINDPIALHFALKLLLDNGAYNSTEGDGADTLLSMACTEGNVELVKLFIADLKINDINAGDRKLLQAAITRGSNIDMLNFLLDAGVNRDLKPDALHLPYREDNHNVLLKVLNTCDVDLNMACDDKGMTVLLKACKDLDVGEETVKVLLHHGADVRIASSNGNTVMHYASQLFDCNKLYELLLYNPPMNTQNAKKQTPLAKLIRTHVYDSGRPDDDQPRAKVLTFQMLVAAGANITADVERELNKLHHKYPQTLMSDYEVSSTRSLKEICRFVIRGALPVPVDCNLSKLPVPELLQEYLNFSELRPLLDEYRNMYIYWIL